ncbi:MAG: hypothetical protein Q9181_004605 [Wetmoreana brouardii]
MTAFTRAALQPATVVPQVQIRMVHAMLYRHQRREKSVLREDWVILVRIFNWKVVSENTDWEFKEGRPAPVDLSLP